MADARKRELPEAPYMRSPTTYREADAYLRPGRPGVSVPTGSTLTADLASSLKMFTTAAKPFMERWRAGLVSEEEGKGAQSADEALAKLKGNRDSFNKLIKDGTIPPGASPHFRDGFYRQAMRVASNRYEQEFRAEYETSAVKNKDDPAEFATFASEFRQKWIKENLGESLDRYAVDEFLPRAAQAETALSKHHIAFRTQEIERQLVENTQQEILGLLDKARADGTSNPAAIGAAITELKDSLVESGARGSIMSRAIVDAIKMRALEENNASLLHVLDFVKAGTGPLSGTQYAREQRYIAEKGIARESERRTRAGMVYHEKAMRANRRKVVGDAVSKLIDDPNTDVTAAAKELARQGDAAGATALLNAQHTLQTRAEAAKHDRGRATDLIVRSMNPDDETIQEDMATARKKGEITNEEWGRGLSYNRQAHENPEAFRDPRVKQFETMIRRSISGSDMIAEPGEKAMLGDEAVIQFKELYGDWFRKNPDAGPAERFKAMKENRALVLDDELYGVQGDWRKTAGERAAAKAKEIGNTVRDAFKAPERPGLAPAPSSPQLRAPGSARDPESAFPEPNEAQINMLRQSPELAPHFDSKFGPGAADKILKGNTDSGERKPTGDKTENFPADPDGFPVDTARPALNNPDGSISTEVSITLQIPELYGERWVNIPTIWGGKRVSEEEAVRHAIEEARTRGWEFPNFASVSEAEEAARRRSDALRSIRKK